MYLAIKSVIIVMSSYIKFLTVGLVVLAIVIAMASFTGTRKITGSQIIISTSASTNSAPWKLYISPDGSGSLVTSPMTHGITYKNMSYAIGTFPYYQIVSDLSAIGNIGGIPGHSCPKSVSFGTSTTISFNNKTSGDISCINSGDPKSYQNLWNQTTLAEREAGV